MSGIPSISESYAVVGNPWSSGSRFRLRVSLVVLTRGPSLFRPDVLADFHSLGFFETLCLETGRPHYDAPTLVRQLPVCEFLSTSDFPIRDCSSISRPRRFAETGSWSSGMTRVSPEAGLHTRIESLWQQREGLALVPELRDRKGRELPSVLVPGLEKDRLKILALGADQENVDTLFASDYTALYHRRRFLHTGGYDAGLTNSFWQKVDWGLRSRLWGESLTVERAFKVDYSRDPPVEDQTSRSFVSAVLSEEPRRAPRWGSRCSSVFTVLGPRPARRTSWGESLAGFLREREWVQTHRYLFQTDARVLTELWGSK